MYKYKYIYADTHIHIHRILTPVFRGEFSIQACKMVFIIKV